MTVKNATKTEETKEATEVYKLWDLVNRIDGATYSMLSDLVDRVDIATPAPAFVHSGSSYWSQDTLPVWQELVDKEIQRISSISYTKAELTDLLMALAKDTKLATAHTYSRGRGLYSKAYAKKRVSELEGAIKFVSRLGDAGLPKEQSELIYGLLANSKENAGMS